MIFLDHNNHRNCKKTIKTWAAGTYESFATKNWLKKMGVCNDCIDKIEWERINND